jgi:hypothetical protein
MTNSNGGGGFTTSLGAVLGIATTLVVAVFAALGVSGNLLARMVRNHPTASSHILVWAIAAVVLIAAITAIPQLPNWLVILPVAMLGVVLCRAAFTAADSQRERENPSISLTLSQTESKGLMLTAKATASSLGSQERMLLRVAVITRPLSVKLREIPNTNPVAVTTELRDVTNQECKRPQLNPYRFTRARVLSWTETGANASGEATAEQAMPLPDNARYVCAWVIMSERPEDVHRRQEAPDEFNVPENIALVDLKGVRNKKA